MYIHSDNEALFKQYIRICGYAPASIRNIDSDISFFFKWLATRGEFSDVQTIIGEFERYMVLINSNEHTSRRRLSTVVKFLQWLDYQKSPSESSKEIYSGAVTERKNDIPADVKRPPTPRKLTHKFYLYLTLFFVIIIGISSTLFLTYYRPHTEPTFEVKSKNILRFTLRFRGVNRLTERSNDILSFSYYSNDSQNSYIGYSECPLGPDMFDDSRTSVTVLVGSNCGSMPAVLDTKLSSGEYFFADLYLNDVKLNNTKLKVSSQSAIEGNSSYHNGTDYPLTVIGNEIKPLPNDILADSESRLTYPKEASVAGVMDSRLVVGSLLNKSVFQDGDVIGYLNGQIDRALMSTKVLGVLSGDYILTEGMVSINYLQTSDMIYPGDYVSTSIEPGYGTKANNINSNIFGVALEPYSTSSGKLKVLLYKP